MKPAVVTKPVKTDKLAMMKPGSVLISRVGFIQLAIQNF